MPQLETSTYLTQIFWLIVTFLSFWLIMHVFIVPKISETIEARKRKYDDFILKAEEVNKKALLTLHQYEKTVADAKEIAAEEIRKNEAELKKVISEKEADVNNQIKEKAVENENQLNDEKKQALNEVDEISQTAAYEILQKLNIKTISLKDIQQIYEKENI